VRPHNPTAAVGSGLQKEIAMARDSYEAGLKISLGRVHAGGELIEQ
jgi:hypothetical protein